MNIAKVYKTLTVLCLASLLCSCNTENNSTATNEISEASSDSVPFSETTDYSSIIEKESIRVQAIKLDESILSYEYEGQKQDKPLIDGALDGSNKKIVEKVINNTLGENVTAIITLNYDNSKILICDALSLNGEEIVQSYLYEKAKNKPEWYEVKMDRINGSVFRIYTEYDSITADMNLLANEYKYDFPDKCEGVIFSGYKFNSGNFIPIYINAYNKSTFTTQNDQKTEERLYEKYSNTEKYNFFGTIQSLNDERAEVLLNDGKTVCDVPNYYFDGELKVGLQVMVTLNAEPTLFGSGEKYKDEFAVFYTDTEEFNTSGEDFSELAYAQFSKTDIRKLIYTKVGEIQK